MVEPETAELGPGESRSSSEASEWFDVLFAGAHSGVGPLISCVHKEHIEAFTLSFNTFLHIV